MKKLTSFLIGSLLVLSVACDDTAKTTVTAPETGEVPASPATQTTQEAQEDAQSEVRRRQLNADIRAREERNLATGDLTDRAAADLASQVRSKLEANIPGGQLTVKATEDGLVTVSGTVGNQEQLAKIEPLAKEINGVKNVVVETIVTPPQN
ncbi:BON domain-containing protein [Anabaena cylindrica FACHB-243]|uniref:Transport-associated protein n=1 Tax=Anabaena cylindrica (strain ATCC 27899 / PCC 7122) TaxID=272123 RepID=K9ZP56_ANACC|nr:MULTISPECIES: BON domain-containing protein [Anabaena]AFZ60579.1 transport-associated protein [Anabaena cylindrica PCC 7122]MBD2418291.1 BON domain-containing protein [Anabaena cylindrica FACHB-243]MBY5283265.1 BON domain-containing protein [Anabaena sp. CCAP 1446/1C]MBY5306703.1 BON domain-containing protein [Anabaena sp. CCAP 1446/1C]MCM2408808.1 BON domain-containing protein [Anabaena sp. CCAP 1446/1C]